MFVFCLFCRFGAHSWHGSGGWPAGQLDTYIYIYNTYVHTHPPATFCSIILQSRQVRSGSSVTMSKSAELSVRLERVRSPVINLSLIISIIINLSFIICPRLAINLSYRHPTIPSPARPREIDVCYLSEGARSPTLNAATGCKTPPPAARPLRLPQAARLLPPRCKFMKIYENRREFIKIYEKSIKIEENR